MKLQVSIILFVFSISFAFSQKKLNDYTKIEDLITFKKLDSASFLIAKQKELETTNYLKVLERITNHSQTYSDYYKLASKINNRATNDLNPFIQFVSTIPVPTNKDKINLEYVYTNWLLVTKLRNASKFEQATQLNNKLQIYIQAFNSTSIDVEKANLLLSNHQIVMFLIEGNYKDGKALTLKGLETATNLEDNTLRIIFLNHLSDFLIEERNLDGYIKNCELSLSLESDTNEKSPYYIQTLEKLIDAYIFKGGNNTRINELLTIIYSNPNSKKFSYSLYANFLRTLEETSPITQDIFNQFKVTNYIDFCNTIETQSEDQLDQNQFYNVLSQSSQLLEAKNYLKEAIAYKTKCVNLTRKIYSEDLSNSLANYRTEQAVKGKELELTHQKDKTKLYTIIMLLSILVLVILIFVIAKKNKREKLLKAKNLEIEQQRDAIHIKEKEKSLLLKEVHHRVKNNFQIVASLLELQTKEIEDEKALELANEGKNRIKSMAIIHQKLYQNDNNLIDFDEYIKLLVNELTTMYSSKNEINTSIKSENIYFDVDTAIPLGLIINELITNAYKYAFEGDNKKNLIISIEKEENDLYKLIVSDNGPGLNKSIDLKKIKSLGLRLVTRLVKQLQGSLVQNNDNGAYFEVQFKDSNLRKMLD
tara:strand:+ start:2603 stop:4546 length:1944 start_codon:yes stop_codon:yes gene_type:complete